MGKNYSLNNATKKRKESDFYETPYCLIRTFLSVDLSWEDIPTLDPCCGKGAIGKVLKEYKLNPDNLIQHDIEMDGVDFLSYTVANWPQLISNPPYSLANEFILHAKEVATKRFAFLLPLSYLQGSKRYNRIWKDEKYPLHRIYVFNRFPMMGLPLREDGMLEKTGMIAMAWYVWENSPKNTPEIHWLDIDSYILHKKDLDE
jgi:hypothetical protein